MIIRREALTAAMAATTADDSRYSLNAVQIELRPTMPTVQGEGYTGRTTPRIVGTDGHVLLMVDDHHHHEDGDFPIVPGTEFNGDPSGPIVVPVDLLRSMIAATPKQSRIPILRAIRIGLNGSPTSYTVAATDLQAPRVATVDTSNQKFPSYDRVLPAADRPSVSVTLSVEVLETLIKAAKAIHASGTTGKNGRLPTIRFSLPTGKQHRDVVTIPGAPAVDATETTPAIAAVEPRETVGDVTGCVGIMITNPGDGFSIIGAAMPCRP